MVNGSKHILIAEDEKPMAKALSLKLIKAGFEVTAISNGADALQEIEKGGYDLVLLDLMMPQKDGFTVLEELQEKGLQLPIIVTSNLSQEEDKQKAKKLGAIDFLVKSDTPIINIIERVQAVLKT